MAWLLVRPLQDLSSGKELITPIPGTSGDVVWANDNETLFYTVKDHLDRPYKVFRHKIGATGEGELIYHEEDEVCTAFGYELAVTRCGWLGMDSSMVFVGATEEAKLNLHGKDGVLGQKVCTFV